MNLNIDYVFLKEMKSFSVKYILMIFLDTQMNDLKE